MRKSPKKQAPKRSLALPDLEHAKSAVVNSRSSAERSTNLRPRDRLINQTPDATVIHPPEPAETFHVEGRGVTARPVVSRSRMPLPHPDDPVRRLKVDGG